MGWFFSKAIEKVKNIEEIEITLTMVAAHTTFLLSELISYTTMFEISGIISTAIAGIIM
jgi:CPA1 family monovalent cation:H+ antiporter